MSDGREVVDQARRLRRGRVGGEVALGHRPTLSSRSSWIRSRRYGDVEVGRDAEAGAVEAEAADELDRAPPEHREPHVVDHLAAVVLVHRDGLRAVAPRPPTASDGNGNSVIGRTKPTRAPSARSWATAERTYFAGVPNATTTDVGVVE